MNSPRVASKCAAAGSTAASAKPGGAKMKVNFEIAGQVKVLDGPFASFNGLVEEIDYDRARVKVSVSIFGPFCFQSMTALRSDASHSTGAMSSLPLSASAG